MRAFPYVSAALLALSLSASAPASSEAQRPSWAGPNQVLPAQAGPEGVYESPMMTLMNGTPEEVPSDGKIGRDGRYKVEIDSAQPGTYTLCLIDASGAVALGEVEILEPGELKFEGTLGPRTLVGPSFKIILSGGDCALADAVYYSGLQTG